MHQAFYHAVRPEAGGRKAQLIVLTAFLLSLIIVTTLFSPAIAGQVEQAETSFTPWSGYWWPTIGGGLANGYSRFGHPAPLEKYEQYLTGAYPGNITQWELDNYYDPNALSWYGRCHAWAAAAASEKIRFYPSSINNIIFRVGDKKGLMTSAHGDDPAVRATTIDSPQVFHEWLLLYIKEHGKPFVADLGSDTEAWFYPVYKYEMDTIDTGSYHQVSCRIWYADDRVDPDFQGTKPLTLSLTYKLFVNGNGEITGGEWTGNSVYERPKSMFFPLAPQPDNPNLDYDTVKQIASHRDDWLESDDTVVLSPGSYNLVLLDKDTYQITCQRGDTLSFLFARLDQLENPVRIRLVDASGIDVFYRELDSGLTIDPIVAGVPPYILTIEADDYTRGNIYRVVFDLHRPEEYLYPDMQKAGGWNGFAVTNHTDTTIKNLMAVGYDTENRPVRTLLSPVDLPAKGKETFLISNLPIPMHEAPDVVGIKVLAEGTVGVVYLGGIGAKSMAGLGHNTHNVDRLILPDTATMYNVTKYISWSLHNPFSMQVPVNMILYNEQGNAEKEVNISLPPFTVNRYTAGNNPFQRQLENGWIDIRTNGGQTIEGYFKWTKDGNGGSGALFALSRIGNVFYVPHIATAGIWNTEITMMNLAVDTTNTVSCLFMHENLSAQSAVTLSPGEKKTIDICMLFPDLDTYTLNQGALLVSSQESLSGFFRYRTSNSSASFELMTDNLAQKEQIVPHIASDNYWWTGIALFNASNALDEATLYPYDHNGNLIEHMISQVALPAHAKKVALVKSIFGASNQASISWVKIRSAGENTILGLFLYGDKGINVLSGSNLFPNTLD